MEYDIEIGKDPKLSIDQGMESSPSPLQPDYTRLPYRSPSFLHK